MGNSDAEYNFFLLLKKSINKWLNLLKQTMGFAKNIILAFSKMDLKWASKEKKLLPLLPEKKKSTPWMWTIVYRKNLKIESRKKGKINWSQ